MVFRGPANPHHEGNGEMIEGANDKLMHRINELRKWQEEQQQTLNKQHDQQIQRLKKEQKDIQEMFRTNVRVLQPEDCLTPTPTSKSDSSAMPVSSSVWNKLILPHSSPSERFDRAGQLANLLKTSESDVQVDLRLDSDVQVDLRSDDANGAENKKLCSILKKAGRKTPGFVPPTGIELNRNSLPNKPKFPFLRKGHSLTKYKSSKMKNPERCLGVRGLINENVQFNDNKSKPVHRDVKIDSEQPDEVFQSLHSDLNTNFDPAGQIIHPKPILPTSIKNNYISDPSLDEHSLREFEFLERAAEQTSFISSSSIVSQALQINPFDLKKDERLSNISERCENEDDMRITEDQKTSLAEMDEGNLMKSSFPTKFPSTEDSIDLSLGNIDFLDESSWLSTKRHSGFSSSASLSLSREDFCPKSPSLSQSTNCISPKFINRYFSKFRPEADEIIPTAEKNTGDAEILNESTLGNHLIELQKEIERFRQENLQLTNLRNQQKIYQKQLEQEKKAFEVYKQQETERITKYLESEKQKTRKERELYDAYLKTRPQFDKQERKELLKLKTEVEDVKLMLRDRERKWNETQKRLQDRVNLLEKENHCVKSELQTVEQKYRELTTQQQRAGNENRKKTAIASSDVRPLPLPNSVLQSRTEESFTSFWTDSPSEDSYAHSNSYAYSIPEQLSHVDNTELFSLNPNLTLIKTSDKVVETLVLEDGCVERLFSSGTRELRYSNETRKEISSDGKSVMVFLFNGDVKHILADEKIVYYFAENRTTHTTYPDGLQVYHFANNQLEKHFPDGNKQITFPDRSIKFIYIDGSEESVLEDGTRVQTNANGDCVMQFPNGQKEVHTDKFKKRIFLDGTIKLLFPDGKQETRYANGRVRIKNKDGELIVDQKMKS